MDAVGHDATERHETWLGWKQQHLHLLRNSTTAWNKPDLMLRFQWEAHDSPSLGQVLGCNYSGDDDTIGHYLFLGSGDFHPIGLVLHTGKPLAMLDPYSGDAIEMSFERIERILRQRFGLIMSSMDAEKFGILIGENLDKCDEHLPFE